MKYSLKLTSVSGLTAIALTTTVIVKKESAKVAPQSTDSSTVVRTKNVREGKTDHHTVNRFIKPDREVSPAKMAATLAGKGEDGVDDILLGLGSASSYQEQLIHSDALALIGSQKAIKGLISHAMTEADRDKRAAILESLKALSNPGALPALAEAVTSPLDSRSLGASIDALGRLADSATINELVERYRTDPAVKTRRGQITKALSNIVNIEAVRTLASVARTSPEPGLVEAASRALSKIGNATAAQGLADTLEGIGDRDPVLSASIEELIRRVDQPEGQRILANLQKD